MNKATKEHLAAGAAWSRKFKEWMDILNLFPKEAAQIVGQSPSNVRYWLREKRTPRNATREVVEVKMALAIKKHREELEAFV
jgi:hypothetical protein